jgi:hypothetical protein
MGIELSRCWLLWRLLDMYSSTEFHWGFSKHWSERGHICSETFQASRPCKILYVKQNNSTTKCECFGAVEEGKKKLRQAIEDWHSGSQA